jgi:hypothetical protein
MRIWLLFLLFISIQCHGQEWIGISNKIPAEPECKVSEFENGLRISFSLPGFFSMKLKNQSTVIALKGGAPINEYSYPDLPKFSKSIMIPDGMVAELHIISSRFSDVPDMDISPSTGEVMRNNDPQLRREKIHLTETEGFWPSNVCYSGEPYILRDFKGVPVVFQPLSYNSSNRTLRIYHSIDVELKFHADPTRMNFKSHPVTKEFADIYSGHFINNKSAYTPVQENGELLIICPAQWLSILQPFVIWKIRKGIPTTLIDAASAGNTVAGIKNYISGFYQQHNLTHVLLIGDHNFIPTPISGAGAADPLYGYINGNDSYPEVFIGRFSAETSADVQTMCDRVLNYEMHPDTTSQWASHALCIGSNLGPGDDNEFDWEHEANIRSQLLAFTYTDVAELYDGTHAGTNDLPGNPLNSDVVNIMQNGVSLINYTGHGTNNGFSTTGFSIADISTLTTHNLPFVWSVGCTNGNFNTNSPCMAEAFLRAQQNGLPTGAVAVLMSSINQYWNAPMDAQDEMNAILTEADNAHSEEFLIMVVCT